MTTVTIAGEKKDLEDVTERWINNSINGPKSQGLPICVQVRIQEDGLRLDLPTPGCAGSGSGGGRPPNQEEVAVMNLWNQQGLNSPDYRGGNLIAFLKQLQRKHL